MIFPDPAQFQYPVCISLGAAITSACCYAAYVRIERGHLIHLSTCMKSEPYQQVNQAEPRTP
jgi:solute carrier family 40 (iron-regulated transporter), member 1